MHDWGRDNHRVSNGVFGYSGRDLDFLLLEDAAQADEGLSMAKRANSILREISILSSSDDVVLREVKG